MLGAKCCWKPLIGEGEVERILLLLLLLKKKTEDIGIIAEVELVSIAACSCEGFFGDGNRTDEANFSAADVVK